MTSPMLQVSNPGMQQLIMSLENHAAAMIQAGQTAERINEEVAAGYIADSSTIFQRKVQDWVDNYKNVMQKFQQLAENSGMANQVLNTAEQDAGVAGGNWGVSDGVYSALAH